MRVASALATGVAQASRASTRDVPAQRTPASLSDLRASLTRALQSATGQPPRASAVDVLLAQVSLETGHGEQMYNFNFGGIKGTSPSGQTATYMTREVLGGQDVHLQQGFRAYSSLDEGAKDYVSVLRSQFPAAFSRAAAGDVVGFAHALKQSSYYTASEQEYTAGLEGIAGNGTASATAALTLPPGEFSTSDELSRVLDAVAASAARIAEPTPEG